MSQVPYSIRCLSAIESMVGGREPLALRLGKCKGTIDSWHHFKKIPTNSVVALTKISDNKFCSDELLGLMDNTQIEIEI